MIVKGTGNMRLLTFSKFVLLTLLLAAFAVPAWAEQTYADWSALKTAICNLNDGETLTIDGTYTASNQNDTITITKSITLRAAEGAHPELNGNTVCRVIKVDASGKTVTLDGLTITKGKAKDNGGGMCVFHGTVNVANCVFTHP